MTALSSREVKEMQLPALVFREQFERFREAVRLNSKDEFRSFREGLPKEWEGYKEDIYTEGRRRLTWSTWKKAEIESGTKILNRVVSAIEIAAGPGMKRNNLVAWSNRFGEKGKTHRKLLAAQDKRVEAQEYARVLSGLYLGSISEPDAFEPLKSLLGARYDLLAYLFFLKDWDRFMPIAPENFDQAFKLLGIDLKTAHRCSWDNYDRFNDAIRSVQGALRDIAGLDDVRMIDAHSFCWMLVRLKTPAEKSKVNIPLPKPLLAVQPGQSVGAHKSDVEGDETFTMTDEGYAERDEQRRKLGRLAQDIALQSEQRRLREGSRPELAEQVMDVSDQPKRGYDILSFEVDGSPRHIEVKAARRSGNRISFFLSENERRKSGSKENYYFYLVSEVRGENPAVEYIPGGHLTADYLTAIDYSASVIVDSKS